MVAIFVTQSTSDDKWAARIINVLANVQSSVWPESNMSESFRIQMNPVFAEDRQLVRNELADWLKKNCPSHK
jgi:hypothetical protein